MGIAVINAKGEIVPKDSSDPRLAQNLQITEKEQEIVLKTCNYKGVQNFNINPKVGAMSHLIGYFDDTSREWTDGVIANSIRQCSNDTSGKRMIISIDGPIDPDWVENLNSVLDDNKRLSLYTGEMIYLTPYMNIVLETSNLDSCTPATISRCAICYIRRTTLPLKALFNSWLSSLPKILHDQQERLDQYVNFFISEILENFLREDYLIYPLSHVWTIMTFIRLFNALI